MNKQMNKRSVVTTIIVCLVCLVIVTGSTFSLFTSQDDVNIAITSGEVEMIATINQGSLAVYSKGVQQTEVVDGKHFFQNHGYATLEPKKLTLTNITPGDKVNFQIKLNNTSNVDIQYRVIWTVETLNGGDASLAEALVATADEQLISTLNPTWTTWLASAEDEKLINVAVELPLAYEKQTDSNVKINFHVEAVQGNHADPVHVSNAAQLQDAIDAGSSEIILDGHINLSESITIGEAPSSSVYSRRNRAVTAPAIKIDLNGYSINYNGTRAAIVNNGNVTISGTEKGGEISAPNGVAIENNAAAVVEAVEIAGAVTSSGALTLTETTITVEGDTAAISTSGAGSVVVESGSYSNENGTVISGNVTVKGGEFDGKVEANDSATPTISGGDFSVAPDSNFFEEGSTAVKNEDGSYSVGIPTDIGAVAIVNGTYYNTIQKAVDEAANGATITMFADATLNDSIVITDKNITIDLNGKTITAAASIADSENCVLIMNRGNLVITNGTINVENATAIRNHGATANLVLENMTVTQTGSDVPTEWLASAVFTSGGATTVIENGTYTGVSSAVIVATSGGNLTINGGTFTAEKTAARVDSWSYKSVLTINDGTFNSANKALYADGNKYVTVNGGTFNATIDSTYTNIDIKGGTFNVSIKQPGGHQNKYAISGGTFVDDVNKYVANGYSAVDNLDGTYTVLFPQESFDSLIENAGENATIEIPAGNYTFPASDLKAGQTLNCAPGTVFEGSTGLNANGATIIGATFSNPTGAAGTSTVNGYYKNCTFDGKNGLRWCYAGDVVVFENCVFSGDTYGVHFDGGAKEVKFIDCTFSGFNAIAGDVKLTMEGCTFEANGRSNYNGINLWGSATLTNCTFVFDGKAGNEWVDARGSNTTLTFTGCVVTDGETTKGLETVVGNGGTGNTIIIDGVEYVYTADELIAAINAAEDGATIYLTAGDYALRFTNNISFNVNNLTIKGMGDVNLAISSSEAWYGRVQGSNVIFENIHFTSAVGATGKATYNNCTFDSWAICASSNKEETYYNNCTINGCLNTSTDLSSGDIYVKGCKIAMAEYSGSMTVNFENCEIDEVIIWNSNTNFTNCEITTLNDDNVTSATVTIK